MVPEREVVPLRTKSRELTTSKSTISTITHSKKPLASNINILNQTKKDSTASFNSRKSKKQDKTSDTENFQFINNQQKNDISQIN